VGFKDHYSLSHFGILGFHERLKEKI